MTTSKPQTISYPAPGARPYRHEDIAVDPHVVVLFGATGDLARRKLIPGLAYLDQSELAPHIEIVATSLEDLTREEFLEIATAKTVITPDEAIADAVRRVALKVVAIEQPRSDAIARLGWKKILTGETVSPEELDANYIRRSNAEIFSKTGL